MQHPMQPLVNDPICEEAVINILLSNENLYSETAEILSPKMFHTPKFAHIYNAISKIYSQGDSPNFIAVEQWLAQNEPKSGVDEMVLLDILSSYHTNIHLKQDCLRIRELWQRRELWQIGKKLSSAGTGETYPLSDAVHDAVEGIGDIGTADESNILSASKVMEQLQGILIATTNLECNLDSAFERRFLYKLRFERPDTDVRAKIWQSMIKGLRKNDALTLAERYELSGGQIENVARKHTINDILFGRKQKLVDTLAEYCENERLEPSQLPRIGFNR